MIAWLNPAAFAGLAALAVPVLIHLLRQHQARRVLFPSLRFVHRSRTAAIRLRRISEPWLLLLRLAALALAVCALAQPVVVTTARLDAWGSRIVRAVVVDTSDSMRVHGAAQAAGLAAAAEIASAFAARRIDTPDLRAGVRLAADWLDTAPPAAREIVIISDFQPDALTRAEVDAVPGPSGVRTVPVGEGPASYAMRGEPVLWPGGRMAEVSIAIDRVGTTTGFVPRAASPDGLRLLSPPQQDDAVQSLRRAVSAAGTLAPSPAQPITVVFAGASHPGPLRAVAGDWMLGAVLRLMADPDLRSLAGGPGVAPAQPEPWTVVASDDAGRPMVRAAASGDALVLEVAAAPASYLAAVVVRTALDTRVAPGRYGEQDILRVAAAEVASWSRTPAPLTRDVARYADRTDAPWFWGLALLVLGVEAWLRRAPADAALEVRADAA